MLKSPLDGDLLVQRLRVIAQKPQFFLSSGPLAVQMEPKLGKSLGHSTGEAPSAVLPILGVWHDGSDDLADGVISLTSD